MAILAKSRGGQGGVTPEKGPAMSKSVPPKNAIPDLTPEHVYAAWRTSSFSLAKTAESLSISSHELRTFLGSPTYLAWVKDVTNHTLLEMLHRAAEETPSNLHVLMGIRDNDDAAPRDRVAAVKAIEDIFREHRARFTPPTVRVELTEHERRTRIEQIRDTVLKAGPLQLCDVSATPN